MKIINYFYTSSLLISLLLIVELRQIRGTNTCFKERFSWSTLTFKFPFDKIRENLIKSKEYVPISNVPLGIEIWKNRFFVSVPRWLSGIVSTLNYFEINNRTSRSPTLIPYPKFESNYLRPNQHNFENNIVSVFRLKVDACDRLWFVDTGLVDIIGNRRQVIAPRLFIVNLQNDRLVRIFPFDKSLVSEETIFGGNLVVDVTSDTCDQAYAYVADPATYRIVVYSFKQNRAWRIKHPYFFPDPSATAFIVRGIPILWTIGVLGTALSSIQSDGFRILYFSPLSSNNQFSVNTKYLRDGSIASNTSTLLRAYNYVGYKGRHMQSTATMLHEPSDTLFYTLVNRNGIGCWNTNRYAKNNSPETNFILATDDKTMIFPNDIIFDNNDNIWILSDQLAVSNHRRLNANNVNFRLFSAPVSQVIQRTICDSEFPLDPRKL